MPEPLKPGDPFPEMSVTTTQGKILSLPGDLEGKYSIVLFYRGHW